LDVIQVTYRHEIRKIVEIDILDLTILSEHSFKAGFCSVFRNVSD
jgi:hypothetical protein